MKLARHFLALCFISLSFVLSAQDGHFTLYDYAPLSVNPAYTGNYSGTYRIGGIYRDQWSAISGGANAFRTPMVYVDAPLLLVGKKGHWVGAGLMAQLDEAGSLNQKTNNFGLSASFNYLMNRKKNTVVSLGLQGVSRTRSLKDPNFNAENTILNTGEPDNVLQGLQAGGDNAPKASGFVVNAGVSLKTALSKKASFVAGISAMNINAPNQSLSTNSQNSKNAEFKLPLRMNAHAGVTAQLNDKWTLNPTLLFSTIRNQNEIDLQVWADYLLNKEKEIDLRFGLGHRLGRDIQPLVGINYGNINAAIGYDIRLGGLGEAITRRGGVELAVSYTGVIFKKPEVPPVFFCPQL